MFKQTIILLIASLLIVTGQEFFQPGKSDVMVLNKNNFANTVFGTESPYLVMFYAPWCGHCKNMKPEYEKAASNVKGLAKLGAINCDVEKELCGHYGIQGFPTVKYFPSQAVPNPKEGKNAYHKVPEDYQSGRTASDLVKFITSKIPSFVTKVTTSSFSKFLTSTKTAKAILFTDKATTSNLYKALSVDFHYTLPLGEARDKDVTKELLEKYSIDKYPTLVLFESDDESKFTKYDGKLNHESITAFLEPHQSEPTQQPKFQPQGNKNTPKKEAPAEPTLDHPLKVNDQATFDKHCGKGGLCSLFFFDMENPDEVESNNNYLKSLESLAKKFAGRIKVLYLDGSKQTNFIKEFDLAGLPNMVVINTSRMRYSNYLGSFSLESLEEFYDNVLLGKKSTIPVKTVPSVIDTNTKEQPSSSSSKKVKDEL